MKGVASDTSSVLYFCKKTLQTTSQHNYYFDYCYNRGLTLALVFIITGEEKCLSVGKFPGKILEAASLCPSTLSLPRDNTGDLRAVKRRGRWFTSK